MQAKHKQWDGDDDDDYERPNLHECLLLPSNLRELTTELGSGGAKLELKFRPNPNFKSVVA